LTFTVPTTGNYNVACQVTLPSEVNSYTGAGGGTARDLGLGATGGFGGAGSGAQLGLGNGAKGLGFGGSNNDDASGFASGYGAGAGGGDAAGFARGGLGTGDGAVGQGFGPAVTGYQQPPVDIHESQTATGPVTSSLVITVKQNGTTIYTAPTPTPSQNAIQFKTDFPCTAADSITVNFTSSNANDEQLSGIQANVSIGQGF
jgi:hypothetical protein